MPKLAVPLTETKVKNAKPKEKIYTLGDGDCMYLEVHPNGKKQWLMAYRRPGTGKNNRISFGEYPDVGLAEARSLRIEARKSLKVGIDPAQVRQQNRTNKNQAAANTFEIIARQWHDNEKATWTTGTAKNLLRRLEKDVFPVIGTWPITDIKPPLALEVIRKIEQRGAGEMARRQRQVCVRIFDYAISSGIADSNPFQPIAVALRKRAKGHHPAISPDELPEFLRIFELNEVNMHLQTRIMMRLLLMTFVRTSELTRTPWSEIDFDNERWVIPWQRMKMGKKMVNPCKDNHDVFLPKQGWILLRKLQTLTGGGQYLFPNRNDHERPSSEWAILAALKRMGYQGRMTGHGFRSLAMGVIKERLNYRHEAVNWQLAHQPSDKYGKAYDRAEFKEEREKMMQDYADYIDKITLSNKSAGAYSHSACSFIADV